MTGNSKMEVIVRRSLFLVLFGGSALMAGTICPASSGTTGFPHPPDPAATGCNVVITESAAGAFSVAVVDPLAYENAEDVLVGIVNNSSTPITSLALTGSGISGFEGDGICFYTFVGSSYCSASQKAGTDPQDYYGPNTTYTNFASGNGLTVNFSPAVAAGGGTTYFSLEGTPAVFTVTTGNTPEPATFALLGGGLGFMLLMRKRLLGRS